MAENNTESGSVEYRPPPEKCEFECQETGDDENEAAGEVRGWKRRILTSQYWSDMLISSITELLGSAVFLYLAILVGQTGDKFAIAFASGATIFVLIASFAEISCGLFNPAVSVGFFIIGEISLVRMVFYILAQCGGAVLGAFTARAILSTPVPGDVNNITVFEQINGGAHFLHGGMQPGLAILAEAIYFACMAVVIYSAAVDKKSATELGPLAIGFVITIIILAGFDNTSGSFNPCRSLGSAVAISYYRPDVWDHHYVYWAGPIAGSIVYSFIYRILFADEKHSIRKQVMKIV